MPSYRIFNNSLIILHEYDSNYYHLHSYVPIVIVLKSIRVSSIERVIDIVIFISMYFTGIKKLYSHRP